ncbi:putative dolichyl pyrophosphate alpha-1 [Escovopsis weberi]|uniref:Alpha-1,3-glucosyltransferase n=1 Tax=Escovopsis weberi TaxID=150374 RepID=A0A0M8MUT1_ESCWE|nr:putative dolichyl pyrophosphate alpha-1 [Escovopsis weberi]
MSSKSTGPHATRNRSKKQGNAGAAEKASRVKPEPLVRTPVFPLASFLWPARSSSSQWEVLPLVLMVVGLFRWAAGLWGYSGFQKPPMFGDFEAQRHWMEITASLPICQWYFHETEYWGLDYPPLTAYHSWILGKIGSLISPEWFALWESRGLEDPNLKIFMRATVIVSEYLVFIPAVVVFVRRFSRLSGVATWTSNLALVAILMQPVTILVDHVHFQYNTVMLGLVAASMSSMLAERYMWAAVFFVAALGFKQMALYYALAVFSYLLGRCVSTGLRPGRLFNIALATIASFAVLLLPLALGAVYCRSRGIPPRPDWVGPLPALPYFGFLEASLGRRSQPFAVVEQLAEMLDRVFPFDRGLFEDKVANFWCALNVAVKLRRFPAALLRRASLGLTLASILPPNFVVLLRPGKAAMPLAFAATAWGFFLFSWQVHEKSVLLPLMPMTLLLAGKQGMAGDIRSWVGFANILGAWTLFPLMKRVDLGVPYAVLTLLWAYLLGLPPTSIRSAYFQEGQSRVVQWATFLLHGGFYLLMGVWHYMDAFWVPPVDKPDLWVVANVGIGAAGFMVCYAWCVWRLLIETDLIPAGDKTKVKKQ